MTAPPLLSVERCRYGMRETTEGVSKIIPELCLVGHVNYHTARPSAFHHHQHPDVLEIFYIVRGKVSWWVEGISTEVFGNELFLIWPDEWHGARDDIVEPAEYYWVQVRLSMLRKGLNAGQRAHLERELRRVRNRKVAASEALLPLYQSLLLEHARREACCEAVVRETLHLLLFLVLRCCQTKEPVPLSKPLHNSRVARSISWTKENVGEATFQGMIAASGLDAASFRKHFCAMTGLSPKEYLVRLRVHKAKEQLAQGKSITQTAHAIGFGSSQYFATVFRKYEGLRPSDFVLRLKRSLVSSGSRL